MGKFDTKPGEPVPVSAEWISNKSHEHAVVDKGRVAPPTPKPGEVWRPAAGTITNPGKKR